MPKGRGPRLIIEITQEEQEILSKHLLYGERKALVGRLIGDFCRLLEKDPLAVRQAIMARILKAGHIIGTEKLKLVKSRKHKI